MINDKTIKTVSTLARIHLTPQENKAMQQELEGILNWITQLDDVNTNTVEPLFSVNIKEMPLRPDTVDHHPMPEKITENATQADYNMFAVPKVVE